MQKTVLRLLVKTTSLSIRGIFRHHKFRNAFFNRNCLEQLNKKSTLFVALYLYTALCSCLFFILLIPTNKKKNSMQVGTTVNLFQDSQGRLFFLNSSQRGRLKCEQLYTEPRIYKFQALRDFTDNAVQILGATENADPKL